MNFLKTNLRHALPFVLCLCFAFLFLTHCGGGETPTPSLPPPRATITPQPSPTPSDFFVSILNRRLKRAELAEVIRKEGTINVGGFDYAARDAMRKQFEAFVEKEFGVQVKLNYVAETAPQIFLENLDAARAANNPVPYDVIAVEENYFLDAQKKELVEKILPSDLLSNASRITSAPQYEPYAVPFQAAATVAPIFHNDALGEWFRDWKDLADARLRRRIVLPRAQGVVAGAFLIGVAGSLGKDYKNADDMRATIQFVCEQIQPNVLKYTDNFSEMQALLRENRIDAAVTWNLLARLERFSAADGTQDIVFRPMRSGHAAVNGYAWIPKNSPHPVLAQLFINWRLSDDGQLPGDAWEISKPAWVEYHEGLLGESYAAAIPEAMRENYFQVYPSVQDMRDLYKPVDWAYYAEHEQEWMEEYGKCVK